MEMFGNVFRPRTKLDIRQKQTISRSNNFFLNLWGKLSHDFSEKLCIGKMPLNTSWWDVVS